MGEANLPGSHRAALDEDADSVLVRRAREGDNRAFEQLFSRYRQEIETFVRSRLDGDAQAAEDITIDVFTKVYRFLDRYRSGSFRGWLFQVTRNTLIDHLRANRSKQEWPLDAASNVISGEAAPDEAAIAAETRAQLMDALAILPPVPRRIVELRLKGYGLADVCENLGMQLGAVKSAQHRAFRKLRDHLQRVASDPGGPL